MKAKDHISKAIQEYPSLYKDLDYDRSRLKVLNHIFFTIGNGYEWAKTKDPKKGGYPVYPAKHRKLHGDWVRVLDTPYGKETYPELPVDYFDTDVYSVDLKHCVDHTLVQRGYYGDDVRFRFKRAKGYYNKPTILKQSSTYAFRSYPMCKYSMAWEYFYDGEFMQQDWLEELIFLCWRTLHFYTNPEQFERSPYFPSEGRIKTTIGEFEEKLQKDSALDARNLRKSRNYPDGDTVPTYEEIHSKMLKGWELFRAEQLLFLNDFLTKHDPDGKMPVFPKWKKSDSDEFEF